MPSDAVAHALGVSTGSGGGRGGGEAIAEHWVSRAWAHASLLRRRRSLASCCAARPSRRSRSEVVPGAGSLPFPTYRCGMESGVSSHPWQSGCVWGGQLCGTVPVWVLGAGGRCVALAPDGAVGVGSVGGPRLGLAVRGWVTWRDLPAGQWIGLGSGRGLGTAAPPPNGLCRGSGAASAGTMASAAQCMGDPGRAEAGDGRVARARGAGRGHPWRRPVP